MTPHMGPASTTSRDEPARRHDVRAERVEQLAEADRVGATVDDHLARSIRDVRRVALPDIQEINIQLPIRLRRTIRMSNDDQRH